MNALKKITIAISLVFAQLIGNSACFAENDANIAIGKTVTANAYTGTVNGLINSNNSDAQSANAWVVQPSSSNGAWASINLNGFFAISKIKIYHGYSDGACMMTDYDIFYSKSKNASPADNEYILLKSFSGLSSKDETINEISIPVSARHIKLVSKTDKTLIRIRELEVYGHETDGEIPTAKLTEVTKTQSGSQLTLQAEVKKNDYEISSVKFYLNSELLGEGTAVSTENYTYQIPTIADGEYTAYAEVVYATDKTVKSNIISFMALDLSANIIAEFLSPIGSTVTSESSFDISAKVTEQNGAVTESVEIYAGESLIKEFSRSEDGIYTVSKKLKPGNYTLKISVSTTNGECIEKTKSITVPTSQITDFTGFLVTASSNGSDSSSTPEAVIDGKTESFTGKNKWYIKDNPSEAWLIINFPSDYVLTGIAVDSGYTDRPANEASAEIITDYGFSYQSEGNIWTDIDGTQYKKEVFELSDEDRTAMFSFNPVTTNAIKLSTGSTCQTFRIREIRLFGYRQNKAPTVIVDSFKNNGVLLDTMDINISAIIKDDGEIKKTVLIVDDIKKDNVFTSNGDIFSTTIARGTLQNGKHTINIAATDDYEETGNGVLQTINIVSEEELLKILSATTRENFEEAFIYISEYLNVGLADFNNLLESKKEEVYFALIGKTFLTKDAFKDAVVFAVAEAKKTQPVQQSPSFTGGGGGGGGGAVMASAPVISTSDTISEEQKGFSDVYDVPWAADAINSLYKSNIISGTGDGKFSPLNNVTRGQFVRMLSGAFAIEKGASSVSFIDVDKDNIFYNDIIAAASAGIVYGDSNGRFNSGSLITREDMAVMLCRALSYAGKNIENSEETYFSDSISEYAEVSVSGLCATGIMSGVGDNRFAPREAANRAMAAKVIYEARVLLGND